jgi:thiol-disulfide isomerase/thioredoxin
MTPFRLTALTAAVVALAATAGAQGTSAASSAPKTGPDSVKVVDITPQNGSDLAALLKTQYATARTAGRTPFVELGATWCGPCKELAASLGDEQMRDAFAGTYIIHLDVDEWKDKLSPLGFNSDGIPAFFPINDKGAAIGPKIDGGAWGDNIPENMAPPLKKFFVDNLMKSSTTAK